MNELVSKLLKLKPIQKAGVTLGAALVIAGLYYQFFYADLSDSIAAAQSDHTRLLGEKADYEKRKIEYLAYRNELKQLQEEQRDLLRVLPKRDEIASFLHSVQEQAELSGLVVENINQDSEIFEDLYVKIPLRMEVSGGFHAISKFFKSVSELRRIVTIEDLMLVPTAETASGDSTQTRLKAKFVAATYRYEEQNTGGGT